MTFTKKSDILFAVMRVETQTHIRNQGVAIAEVRGALQILAQTNLVGKENIQERLKHWEAKLTGIQNRLAEIEFSEDLEWLEPSSDEAVIKSLRERGIDERSIAGEDELAEAKRKREQWLEDKAGIDA